MPHILNRASARNWRSGSVPAAEWTICSIGILLLPITTLLCLRLFFGPTVEPDFRPLALVVGAIGLWIGMYVTAMAITTTYPPVRRDDR